MKKWMSLSVLFVCAFAFALGLTLSLGSQPAYANECCRVTVFCWDGELGIPREVWGHYSPSHTCVWTGILCDEDYSCDPYCPIPC